MTVEVVESYPLVNGLPDHQVTPEQVEEFREKHGHYPVRLIVNPKHWVTWKEYPVPAPMKLPPAIEPISGEVMPAQEIRGYHIPIEYDENVDEHTLECRGLQPLIDL